MKIILSHPLNIKDGNIELKNGRYGFYIRFNNKNFKIDKEKYPEPKNIERTSNKIVNTSHRKI